MTQEKFLRLLISSFPYQPTDGQHTLLTKLTEFIYSNTENPLFLIKGYAGTGKTTIVSTLVKNLTALNLNSVLLAPTGRAAKVLSSYSGKQAFTIHKKIYMANTGPDGSIRLVLAKNIFKNCIFFIDEASMIPDSNMSSDNSLFSGQSLLNDLIDYVYSGKNCKLVFIGDVAQLPPVNLDISPALDIEFLKASFLLSMSFYELKEVVRQSLESGILFNATLIRNKLNQKGFERIIELDGFTDIFQINGELLEDALNDNFSGDLLENSVIITRSNKRANIYNQELRNRILFRENEISAGDLLMVVKNNYYWLDKKSNAGFIANGDIVEILRIEQYEELYGYRFSDVTIRMVDYPEEKDLQVKIMLDTIMTDGPSLSQQESRTFFDEVMKDYEEFPSRRKRIESVKNNPHYNSLQVKFAYALTCHKTQGGQWENVFIDLGYLNEKHIDISFYRWIYTAITRATKKLYLINFPEKFFK